MYRRTKSLCANMWGGDMLIYDNAQLLHRREDTVRPRAGNPWVERLIAVLAVTAGLSVVGSYFEEVLWAVLAVATLATLR